MWGNGVHKPMLATIVIQLPDIVDTELEVDVLQPVFYRAMRYLEPQPNALAAQALQRQKYDAPLPVGKPVVDGAVLHRSGTPAFEIVR